MSVSFRPMPELTDRQLGVFCFNVDSSNPNGCWPWKAGKGTGGYGNYTLKIGGEAKAYRAHRFAFKLANGKDPIGFEVAHKCDNPVCCNPSHLFLATVGDNARDRESKGRGCSKRLGEKNPVSKLKDSQVLQIREMASRRIPQTIIAKHFGIHQVCVSQIALRKTWSHLNQV